MEDVQNNLRSNQKRAIMHDHNCCRSRRKRRMILSQVAWFSFYIAIMNWGSKFTLVTSFSILSFQRHYAQHTFNTFTSYDKSLTCCNNHQIHRPTSLHSSSSSSSTPSSGGHVPEDLINDIKEEADIISVIETHNLPQFSRLSEGRATAICPFHDDNHPSLNIDSSKGLYKCFSCGAGGDVFNFVREYDYLQKQGRRGSRSMNNNKYDDDDDDNKKMSFPAALSKVVSEYCSESIKEQVGQYMNMNYTNSTKQQNLTPEKRAKMQEEQKRRNRILFANSAAADFYAKSLITTPAAGIARSHLFQRGIPPSMVRTFAIGYAPDAYFSSQHQHQQQEGDATSSKVHGQKSFKNWGKGSLVERLQELGLEPKEIVEAGLATVTSAAKNRIQAHRSFIAKAEKNKNVVGIEEQERDSRGGRTNSTKDSDIVSKGSDCNDGELRYADLMDRFRGRLMIPIFDSTGNYVVGFGGRELISTSQENTSIKGANETKAKNFPSPKYLNSPESLVFEKKNLLFGLHTADAALHQEGNRRSGNAADEKIPIGLDMQSAIIIVEGYFDVISLYSAGISEVTASMGAALTYKQLEAAANTLGQGRIVICLDNDDAGNGAVERLCAGNHIWELLEKKNVEVAVASLPDGIKDPGEFVEIRSKTNPEKLKECFNEEVLSATKLWSDWYTDRLISRYDANDSSSFASICDDVTTFLSKNPNAADRTKQAYETAGKLANQISTNRTDKSVSLRIQLESDLLSMASKKAAKKEYLEERKQSVDKLAQAVLRSDTDSEAKKRSKISKGHQVDVMKASNAKRTTTDLNQNHSRNERLVKNGSGRRQYDNRSKPRSIVPHFSGFEFHPTDAAWLGISQKSSKGSMLLSGGQNDWKQKNMDLVYFNSNQYLGNADEVVPLASLSNKLLNQNADKILADAEFRLLKSMINFTSARLAMKSSLASRANSQTLMEWSSPEREWLFHCLTESPGHEPLPEKFQVNGSAAELLSYLKSRPDRPDGAFATESENDIQSQDNSDSNTWFDSTVVDDYVNERKRGNTSWGTLDEFFYDTDDVITAKLGKYSISHDERAELTVQEAVATMLKAAAMSRLSRMKNEWKVASDCLAIRKSVKEDTVELTSEESQGKLPFDNLNTEELEKHCNSIGEEVLKTMSIVRELSDSLEQLGRRLLEYCSETEGRLSKAKQDELAKMLQEHIESLPDDRENPGYVDDYIFGSDEFRYDIDSKYGGLPSAKTNEESDVEDPHDDNQEDEALFESIFE